MKIVAIGLVAALAVACGGSPTVPTIPISPPNPPATDPLPASGDGGVVPAADGDGVVPAALPPSTDGMTTTGPRGVVPGCLEASAAPGVLEWRIANVPLGAKIDRAYGHHSSANCAATEDHLRTQNDHLRFERDPLDPTTLIVRFDRDTYACGRTQIDISINGANVIGEVLKYGSDCTPPSRVCDARTLQWGASVTRVGSEAEARLIVGPDDVGLTVYLSSYRMPASGMWPQTRVHQRQRTMTLGENTFRVPLAVGGGGWQADLACVPGPATLEESFYTDQTLIAWLIGS